MFKPSVEFVEWILAPQLRHLESQRNSIRNRSQYAGTPTYFYLAKPIRDITPTLLPDGHFIIKSGIANSTSIRSSQLRRDFHIFAQALLPDRYIAKDIEDRIQKSWWDYGTMISEDWIKNHEYYGTRVDFHKLPYYIRRRHDCLLHDIDNYNLLVDELNRHFEGEPFPRR